MIKRLNIPNFGSFSGFDWSSPRKRVQEDFEFRRLNILFGRNYSGKTTLSRIFRSLEVEQLPENYPDPDFKIITDSGTLTPQNISSHSLDIRVYNTDFVNENLSFLIREDGDVRPFAIIGSGNKEIEKQIQEIEAELGNEEKKNGKKYKLVQMGEEYVEKKEAADKAEEALDNKLRHYANVHIKKNRIYGEVNYHINDIKRDIQTIREESISALEPSEVKEKTKLLQETLLPRIENRVSFTTNFKVLHKNSVAILATRLRPTKPIQYLLEDSLLQAWVKDGISHHRDRNFCGFCGQELPGDFWEKLNAHFNKESSDLERKINRQLELLEQELKSLEIDLPRRDRFYRSVYSEFRDAAKELAATLSLYEAENRKLLEALTARKEDIFTPKPPPDFKDLSEKISDCIRELNKIIEQNNRQTQTLSADQKRAREELRLSDVLNFINTIDLSGEEQKIYDLNEIAKKRKIDLDNFELHVRDLEEDRDDLLIKLRDEKRGAEKVNKYLSHSFGLDSLRLEADGDEVGSKYKFQIKRGDQPAYNMSEGERSLISFCYFLAKLEDTETKEKEPIIYIDDPVSSLDNNHIFFLFSLIETVLAKPKKISNGPDRRRYRQLFISTHNLDFLKYLKRLPLPEGGKEEQKFFLVEKEEASSSLRPMPKYLKNYQTEFIYLFHQIYKCREGRDSDKKGQIFYSLGNNLRKFLEAYLFYKYPDINGMRRKLHKFFGDDEMTTALTHRIYNELSHLEEIFDRGMRPIDIPELSKVVRFVLNKIKEKDEEQYDSLLNSIGVSPENKGH